MIGQLVARLRPAPAARSGPASRRGCPRSRVPTIEHHRVRDAEHPHLVQLEVVRIRRSEPGRPSRVDGIHVSWHTALVVCGYHRHDDSPSRRPAYLNRRPSGVYLRQFIMSTKSIAAPDTIYERVQQIAAAEGTTVQQLATKAIERDIARRWLDRIEREGDLRRGDMSDAEVEAVVERAVQESRKVS